MGSVGKMPTALILLKYKLTINKNQSILATGKYITELAHVGGSAYVKGYNNVTLEDALKENVD